MALYRISGVWKDSQNVIIHYVFHKVGETTTGRGVKTAKSQAIALLEAGNTATTWVWNYNRAFWDAGERVEVVNGRNGKYLRSNPDNTLTDNLQHLIDYDWLQQ